MSGRRNPARRSGQATVQTPVLPGFGPKTTLALASIGIHSIEVLRASDPFEVYARLKAAIPGVSMNFLYGLIAAVEGCDWREVQRTRRTELLLRLDDMGLLAKR
jgi:DNA transformation protein and related proteins